MIIHNIISSPEGDIPLRSKEAGLPFKLSPSANHPFLCVGDYFSAIKDFLLKEETGCLLPLLRKEQGSHLEYRDIKEIFVRSEKHGALYHIAGIEVVLAELTLKFALSTAISEGAKACLSREYEILKQLNETFRLPYLPKIYRREDVECRKGGKRETLSMVLAEWFEGYDEWHLSYDEKEQGQRLRIWNPGPADRFATEREGRQLFKAVSKILTLYYDTQSFKNIYPWHHAAGDFVVKLNHGDVAVKLTTARKYEPIMVFTEDNKNNPLTAVIFFFLNLALKIRLDKLDGTGEVAWADDFAVEGAIEGFFEALITLQSEGRYGLGPIDDLLSLLKSFRREEIKKLYGRLLDLYQEEAPDDFSVLEAKLEEHSGTLHRTIQNFQK